MWPRPVDGRLLSWSRASTLARTRGIRTYVDRTAATLARPYALSRSSGRGRALLWPLTEASRGSVSKQRSGPQPLDRWRVARARVAAVGRHRCECPAVRASRALLQERRASSDRPAGHIQTAERQIGREQA